MSRKATERGGSHHILPRSRGGGDKDNIYPDDRWPNGLDGHRYWHTLFENMKASEVVGKLWNYMDKNGGLSENFFYVRFRVLKPWKDKKVDSKIKDIKTTKTKKRRDAWQALFGDLRVEEVIFWIEREFIQKEWLKAPQ